MKIVNRDPTHQVIMLGAIAGGLTMLNFFLGAALDFTPTPPPARLVPYLPILTLASPFLGAAVAWSQVPQICFSAAMLLILLGIGVWQAVIPSLPDPNAATGAAANQLT